MKEPKDTYQRPYKMRSLGREGLNTVVSIPRAVLEREARKREISLQEFLGKYVAIANYDNFDGVFYSFELSKNNHEGTNAEGR